MPAPPVEIASPEQAATKELLIERRKARRSPGVGFWLGAMVAISACGRFLAALPHHTITLYPDEYIYPALARSLAAGEGFSIRGGPAHFPAMLESIVTAPLWLGNDPGVSLRLTQALHALLMSLAAVPVYLLARELRLDNLRSLGAAAFTLAIADTYFAAYLTADALAFTLTTSAVLVGVRALARPGVGNQLAFLALSGLATLARLEYVALFAAFAIAAAVVSGRRVLRRYSVCAVAFLLPLVLLPAVGVHRVLGYYSGVTDSRLHPVNMLGWIGTDTGLLALGAAALVPGAVAGLVLGLGRRRSPVERAFAAFAVALALGLLLEASVYATNGSSRFQERYLFALYPWLGIAFVLALDRGRRALAAGIPAALAILVYTAWKPISGYTAGTGSQDSPLLIGQRQIEAWLGVTSGALVLALVASALALVGLLALVRPRLIAPAALALTIAWGLGYGALAIVKHSDQAAKVERTFLPSNHRWVDDAGLRGVAMVVPAETPREESFSSLFWNRSLEDVYLLPGTLGFDVFRAHRARIGADGRILSNGGPLRRPILLEEYADRAQLDGARLVQRMLTASLWRPDGVPRFAVFTKGLYFDGWMARFGSTTVWPRNGRNQGIYVLRLGLPQGASGTLAVQFFAPGFRKRLLIKPFQTATIRIPFKSNGPWQVKFIAEAAAMLQDGRQVSGFASRPPRVIRTGGS